MSTATSHSLPYDPAAVEFDPLLPRLDLANTRRRWRELLDRAETHGWLPRDNQGENVATIKMRMPRRLAAL